MSVELRGGLELQVLIALADPGAGDFFTLDDTVRGVLDGTSFTLGPDEVYVDVTSDVRNVEWRCSSISEQLDMLQDGSCRIVLDNRTRDYDPTNTAGPYVFDGRTAIIPGVKAQVWLYSASGGFTQWTGYVDAWTPQYIPAGANKGDAVMEVDASTGLKYLELDRVAVGSPEGTGEDAGARVTRILNNARWPGPTNIDVGETTMQATTLEGPAIDELRKVADAEFGLIWINPGGGFFFKPRHWSMDALNSGLAFGDTVPTRFEFAYDDDLVIDTATLTATGGTEQTVTNPDSIRPKGYRRDDLPADDDGVLLATAEWLVERRGEPEFRFRRADVDLRRPDISATDLDSLLQTEIGYMATCTFAPPGTGTITQDSFVFGTGGSVDAGSHRIVKWFELVSRSLWAGDFFILDESELDDENARISY